MMESVHSRYNQLQERLQAVHEQRSLPGRAPQLIAVSKRQPEDRIRAVLQTGHRHFGENHLQEAEMRWQSLLSEYEDIQLHLIGPLQSNKVRDAVALFDVIHSVDREKIARLIKEESDKLGKNVPCLIQVNIGEEPQKAGIAPEDLPDFIALCREQIGLDVRGLMAIPPSDENPAPYFALLHKMAQKHDLSELSMGMSEDFETAIRFGATYIRVGTALFGERVEKAA